MRNIKSVGIMVDSLNCKLTTKPWKKIDVHYRNDQYCRPIPGLIELINEFEKNLPDQGDTK